MLLTTNIGAGAILDFVEVGDFFRLLSATAPVTLTFYRNGSEIAKSEGVQLGYAERFTAQPFDRFTITSASAQTVQFVARYGNQVFYDTPPTGNVTLSGMQGAFTQAQAAVTNASGALLAARAARRYLLIQNNDAAGDIYVTLDGTAATTAKGIKIAAGGSYECQGYAPTGQIFAVGSIANNTAVVVVEG